jgi:phage baseplate assembly protein W
MQHWDFPYHFDPSHLTARTDDPDYIRDLIHQVLFTAPGERVNRPTFGSGVLQLVFAPNSVDLGAATQMLVQSALQEWLGDLIVVHSVDVVTADEKLQVSVAYEDRRTRQSQVATFERGV